MKYNVIQSFTNSSEIKITNVFDYVKITMRTGKKKKYNAGNLKCW